jgi:head-tail adaptor
MDAGKRDQLITVQASTAVPDDYTSSSTYTWNDVESPYADVRFGAADEKRQAAQEGGLQSATFLVDPSTALLTVKLTDRIVFDGSNWNITEKALLDRQTLRFTATRSV